MADRTLQVVSVETTTSADTQIAAPRIHIHGVGSAAEAAEHHGEIFAGTD
jgi:hypothetical protein